MKVIFQLNSKATHCQTFKNLFSLFSAKNLLLNLSKRFRYSLYTHLKNKFTLEQATKAQMGNRGIALLFI